MSAAVAANSTETLNITVGTSSSLAGVPAAPTELPPQRNVISGNLDDKTRLQHATAAVPTAAAACSGEPSSHQRATTMLVTPFPTFPNALRLGPATRSAPE